MKAALLLAVISALARQPAGGQHWTTCEVEVPGPALNGADGKQAHPSARRPSDFARQSAGGPVLNGADGKQAHPSGRQPSVLPAARVLEEVL